MKKILSLSLLLLPFAVSAAAPDNGNPTTFLGPSASFGVAQTISRTDAYAISGEFSTSNIRLDGTIGFLFPEDSQRLKISAEYLMQNITYGFASGNTSQWRPQVALGAHYYYELGEYLYRFAPEIGLQAYVSHTPNKSLRTNRGTYTNSTGSTVSYTDTTRITGSTAAGISPGFYLHPWPGAVTGIDLNYDNVQYNNNFQSSEDPRGLGATGHFIQALGDNVVLDLQAGRRQPFNNYQAHLNWMAVPFFGLWTIGVNGEYTIGKERLPSTYNLGLSFDYVIDTIRSSSYSERDATYNFLMDTASSASHMPQVLGASDQLYK